LESFKFEYAVGFYDISTYLRSIEQWSSKGMFKDRIEPQIGAAKAFGMNRDYQSPKSGI